MAAQPSCERDMLICPAIQWAEARITALEHALKPFADFAPKGYLSQALPDDFVITKGSPMAGRQLTIGDLRRAAAALEATGETA